MITCSCPKCRHDVEVPNYGAYQKCPDCGSVFFNVDPTVIVPKKCGLFLIRMLLMLVFLLLTVAAILFALGGNAVFFGASAIPLLMAIACMSENGFRMLTGIFFGVLGCGIAGLVIGYFVARDNAPIVASFFAAGGGLAGGFMLHEILRRSSLFGERCPFCNHRGIRGYGDDIICKHCGHVPYTEMAISQNGIAGEPGQPQMVPALKDKSCTGQRVSYWISLILGIASFIISTVFPLVAVLGFIFLIFAYSIRKDCKCKKCKHQWAVIKISDVELGHSDAFLDDHDAHHNKTSTVNWYEKVRGKRTFMCKYCGNVSTEEYTEKRQLND